MRRWTIATFLALACLLGAAPGFANGRLPASSYIAFSPSDPDFIVARVTFGFLISKDGGKTWDWVCETAIGYSGPEDPAYGIFESNAIAATLASGIRISKDKGCSWDLAPKPVPEKYFVDIAVRRSEPRSGIAAISGYAGSSDDAGNALFFSQLHGTTDNGASWAVVGQTFDPSLLVDTLDVAESDPKRIYVSGTRGSGTETRGYLLVSVDGGQSFIERPIPLGPDDRGPYIAAVDPRNADRLYVRTAVAPDKGARLLVSTDAGKTWEVKLQATGPLTGFALSEDGSRIWAGGARDGLLSASAADLVFTKKSAVQVQCLGVHGTVLWACSNEASGFVLGASKDDGATFESRLHLTEVRGPLACDPATVTGKECPARWAVQRIDLGISTGGDGGVATDGGTTTTTPPPPPDTTCRCDAVGAGRLGLGGAITGIAVALLVLRRRHRDR